MNSDDNCLKSELRKRKFSEQRKSSLKAELKNIIEKQTQDIQEASAHLLFHRKSQQNEEFDVILVIPPKGYHIIDALLQILTEKLPNLTVEVRPHSHYKEQAFYITARNDYLLDRARSLGYYLEDDNQSKLSSLQRQSLILQFLNSLRYKSDELNCHTIGHELKTLKFRENDAIIAKLISLNLIKQVLPLHNESDLAELRTEWVSAFFSVQPLDKICRYFGVKIAIYFAFLGYYTFALLFPSILGIIITFYGNDNTIFGELLGLSFTVMNIVWSTIFLQKWSHRNDKLVHRWSSVHFGADEHFVRPLFRKQNIINIEIDRKLFKYFVSYPIICFSLLFVFSVMFAIFKFQAYWDNVTIGQMGYPVWTSYVPKILLAIMVSIFDGIYYEIAVWLNNKENYRFQVQHENNLILKLIMFQFLNSYFPLLFIAFYIGDMDKLREQLAALLITRQVIGNIKESIIPFLVVSYKLSKNVKSIRENEISSPELESNMLHYESTFDDYLELIIQFGYVMIFSATFPLAAVCALVNNLIEIRSDAFKLCVVHQRPFAGHLVKDIGLWEDIMNAIVYIAIIVNCALIAKTKQVSKVVGLEDDVQLVVISVVLEHFLIALKWMSPLIF